MEGAFAIATGSLRSVSEQQLLDCSNQGGCTGGMPEGGLGYTVANKGLDSEAEYASTPGLALTCNC